MFRENSRKISRVTKCIEFWDFGHRERQTCCEHWVFFAIDSYNLLEFLSEKGNARGAVMDYTNAMAAGMITQLIPQQLSLCK